MFISPEAPTPQQSNSRFSLSERGGLYIAEKGSPIQTITPDVKRVSFSSSTGSRSSRSTTPFSNLVSVNKSKDEMAKIAVAMSSLFDDDDDDHVNENQETNSSLTSDGGVNQETQVHSINTPDHPTHDHALSPIPSAMQQETILFENDPHPDSYYVSTHSSGVMPPSLNPVQELTHTVETYDKHSTERSESRTSSNQNQDYNLIPSLSDRFAALSTLSHSLDTSDPSQALQQKIFFDRELEKAEYSTHLQFIAEVSREFLGSPYLTMADAKAQLQKFLLLPIPQLQHSVFKQV